MLLGVLVDNVGVLRRGPSLKIGEGGLDLVLSTNIKGTQRWAVTGGRQL